MAKRKGRAKRSRRTEAESVALERLSFYVTSDLAGRFRDAAYRLNVSQGQVVTEALTSHLARLEQKHGKFKAHAPRPYTRRDATVAKEA